MERMDKILLQYCFFYKGEDEIPSEETWKSDFEHALWISEMTICVDMPHLVKGKDKKKSFHEWVIAFLGKWWPYQYAEYITAYEKLILE